MNVYSLKDQLIGNLSGGQCQKVLIARALMGHPDLLIFDEPSTGIDVRSQEELYPFIKDLNENKGVTVITVEHNLKFAVRNSTKMFHVSAAAVISARLRPTSMNTYRHDGRESVMFEYAFMQNAFIVALLISIVCPLIGIFLVLRRYSMIGDALSHASLAGVAVGLLFDWNPVLSAFGLTSFFGILIEVLRRRFRRYAELILVIILSLSVGIAITIISAGLVHTNVESFLFGSILTVSTGDVYSVVALSVISLAVIAKLYPQLVMLTFDEDGAQIAGVRSKLINYVFAVLVAATISVSIRIVGILVISSLIALPVATALQLRKGFRRTLIYSVVFSFIDILSGLLLSYYIDAAPGGVTALTSVAMLLLVIVYKECVFSLQEKRRRP